MTPLRTIGWLLRTAWRMGRSRISSPLTPTVLVTLVHRWSDGKDVYFGPLAAHLHLTTLALCETGVACPTSMRPLESLWTWRDYGAFLRGLVCRTWSIEEGFFAVSGRAVRRHTHLRRLLYPCEGRAWERALQESVGDPIRTIGYLHTMWKERPAIKLPPRLVTTGILAKHYLVEHYQIPSERVVVGCNLRDNGIPLRSGRRRGTGRHLLLALGGWTPWYQTEASHALYQLAASQVADDGWTIRLRTHPSTPVPYEPSFLHECSQGSLTDDLAWADVACVIRSWVTIACLKAGVPVIELTPWMFLQHRTFRRFCWTATTPRDLKRCLHDIQTMPAIDYELAQLKAYDWALAMAAPVTPQAMQVFLEA